MNEVIESLNKLSKPVKEYISRVFSIKLSMNEDKLNYNRIKKSKKSKRSK